MGCGVLQLLVVCTVVSLPLVLSAKKLDKWSAHLTRNVNADFNFGQDVRVFEGSGGTFNGGHGNTGRGDTIGDDDDTDFDTIGFSGDEEETGSAVEIDSPAPVRPVKPCLKKLREATGWGAGAGFGAGSSSFIPRCTYTGDYAPIQCHGDECWCADRDGNQIVGTVRRTPLTPDCSYIDRDSAIVRTSTVSSAPPPHQSAPTRSPPYLIHQPHPSGTLPPFYPNEKHHIENGDGNYDNHHHGYDDDPTSQKMARAFINQPGILAAIIAGAVIGLLSAVLLVMFVIYHLRHSRDHADEKANKIPIIGYTNAHDRDLYA